MTAQEPLRRLTAAVLGLAIAACGGGEADPSESGGTEASPQEAAQTAAGLTSAGELPRPCLVGQSIWPGTAVQLMVADAWASCLRSICQSDSTCSNPEAAFNSPNGTLSLNSPTTPHLVGHDLYLGRVGEFMGGVDWLFTNESWSWPLAAREMTFARWAKHRANAALNCRPSEGADGVSVDIGLPDAALPDTLSLSGLNDAGSYSAISPTGRLAAAAELQRPALNLCIAQQLRRSAPGALGAEALLLSEAEQRELLSVIRERAQLAALGAAQIASVTTGEPNPFLGGLELDQIGWGTGFLETSDSRLAIIQRWAMETRIAAGGDAAKTMRAVLTSIGADLGAAVQLHLAATEELANLFARSGSARSPSSSQERENQADDTWGYESWQQRTYALLYGGDPLAVGGFAPWIHPVVTTPPGAASTTDPTVGGDDSWLYGFFPGIVNAADASIVTPVGRAAVALGDERSHFPASRDSGYALEPLRAHESHLALGLLQQHDLLDLVLTGSGDCRTIDPEDTAERWATTLDAALYARACAGYVSTDPTDEDPDCRLASAPGAPASDRLLWRRHRIARSHLDAAAKFLGNAMGSMVATTGFATCESGADAHRPAYLALGTPPTFIAGPPARLHLSRETELLPVSPRERAALFTRIEAPALLNAAELLADRHAGTQGFSTDGPWNPEVGGLYLPETYNGYGASTTRSYIENDHKRRMGSVAALQAVREHLTVALGVASSAWDPSDVRGDRLTDILATAEDVCRAIDGAIGSSGLVVKPRYSSAVAASRPESAYPPEYMTRGNTWTAGVTVGAGDPFWGEQGRDFVLVFRPSAYWVPGLVRAAEGSANPGSLSVLGLGFDRLFKDAHVSGTELRLARLPAASVENGRAWLSPSGGAGFTIPSSEPEWTAFALSVPTGALAASDAYDPQTQQAAYYAALGPALAQAKVVLLGSALRFAPDYEDGARLPGIEDKAHYLAFGGALGTWLAQRSAPYGVDPALPAFDGFGLPQRWVPPFSAELLGGAAGANSVTHLMDQARTTAESARAAVADAFAGMLDRASDEAQLRAAQLRSTEQLRLVEGELCGAAGADCVTPLVSITLGDRASSWYPEAHQRLLLGEPEGGCANALALLEQANLNGELASKQLMRDAMDCALRGRLQQFLAQPALVAQPVLAQLDAELSTVPLFDAYEGGELQAKYVEQFRALRSPAEWLKSLITSTDAMKAQVDSAHRQLRNANKAVKRHCGSSQTLATAATIISTVPGAVGSASGAGAAAAGPVGAAVAGLTAGGAAVYLAWKQNSDACANAKDAVRAAKVSAIAAMMDAQAGAVAAAVGLTDRQAEIVQSGVALSSVAADARIARDRVLLEEKLETYGQRTSFGLYRQYREFDLWRAKALVESSRRFALAARRAVEARFVVDLSEMTAAEPFVSAPATWADEIYEYDLSLPAAVGLTVGATPAAGTYASKIVDYVGNLDAFVTGYSVGRPTAVAQGDVDVLYLPGTADGTPEDFDPDLDPPAVYYPEAGSWLVQCPPTTPGGEPVWTAALAPGAGGVAGTCTDWQSAGCVACVDRDVDCAQEAGCYEPPLRVRIAVALDPWGRLVGDAGSDDLERRHNARWTQLAVNLVGSGVRDCARARDTLACYSQGFVRYSLSHVGPSTVTDFEQRWTALAVPIGRIEGGKALASETVLNPLRDGWQTSYVAPIARTEFADRPMGGAYLLEIVAGPEVRLDRVERIQILAGQSYWVRQD